MLNLLYHNKENNNQIYSVEPSSPCIKSSHSETTRAYRLSVLDIIEVDRFLIDESEEIPLNGYVFKTQYLYGDILTGKFNTKDLNNSSLVFSVIGYTRRESRWFVVLLIKSANGETIAEGMTLSEAMKYWNLNPQGIYFKLD